MTLLVALLLACHEQEGVVASVRHWASFVFLTSNSVLYNLYVNNISTVMNSCICKALVSVHFKHSSHLHKPPVACSSLLRFFFSSYSSSLRPENGKIKVPLADYLINRHHFSPEAALKASSIKKYLEKPENSDAVLLFLKESGFSNFHIENMIKRAPEVLSSSIVKTVEPKIKAFQGLGFSSTDIADVLSSDPWILTRSVDKLVPSILMLKSVLGSNADVAKLLKTSGWFLKNDLEKTMMPNMEYLKSCGVSSTQIVRYVFSFPRFWLNKPDSVKDFVKRVDEIGFDRKSKMFLSAIRTISSMSMENWELKLKCFRSLGFKEDDIVSTFRKSPQSFAVSERKIREVTEVILGRGNLDISFIVNNSWLLICSVERRLKPRLRVFDILVSKNLLRRKPQLTTICRIPEKVFLKMYVLPYSDELGELYRKD
ncbi:hypothetical protein Pint_29331 [Pistacia integerrima]|uniref:Uncharacterized protein n=1 Tax=Pistacia integerrima TaxID=434235 RepID=A0ACC0WYV5_9ROSI|nr:hypothetical protein Pint_29331 [Pistacia integerrima]